MEGLAGFVRPGGRPVAGSRHRVFMPAQGQWLRISWGRAWVCQRSRGEIAKGYRG